MNAQTYVQGVDMKMNKTENHMIKETSEVSLLVLFLNLLKVSAFTFGGGMVMISLMQKEFAEKRGWLTESEIQDIIVIAQSAPGSIAVNASIMLGYKLRKWKGIMVAVLGTIIPPLVILTVISVFYTQFRSAVYIAAMLNGMRAGVAAIVMDVAISMCTNVIKEKSKIHTAIMLIAFVLVFALELNAVYIIAMCVAAGTAGFLFKSRKKLLTDKESREK